MYIVDIGEVKLDVRLFVKRLVKDMQSTSLILLVAV